MMLILLYSISQLLVVSASELSVMHKTGDLEECYSDKLICSRLCQPNNPPNLQLALIPSNWQSCKNWTYRGYCCNFYRTESFKSCSSSCSGTCFEWKFNDTKIYGPPYRYRIFSNNFLGQSFLCKCFDKKLGKFQA